MQGNNLKQTDWQTLFKLYDQEELEAEEHNTDEVNENPNQEEVILNSTSEFHNDEVNIANEKTTNKENTISKDEKVQKKFLMQIMLERIEIKIILKKASLLKLTNHITVGLKIIFHLKRKCQKTYKQ